jgi:hypothetical protein
VERIARRCGELGTFGSRAAAHLSCLADSNGTTRLARDVTRPSRLIEACRGLKGSSAQLVPCPLGSTNEVDSTNGSATLHGSGYRLSA